MRRHLSISLAVLLLAGSAEAGTRVALLGTVVTPTRVYKSGRIVLDDDKIACVGSRCSLKNATVVKTGLDLFPGLVDAHNHIDWNVFPFTRFDKPTFKSRYNWRFGDKVFKAIQKEKSALAKKLKCDLTLYGEAMAALGGTTTIVSAKSCFEGGIRNGEGPGLGGAAMLTVGDPLQMGRKSLAFWKAAFTKPTAAASRFVIHLAEGVSESSLKELSRLEAKGPEFVSNRITSIVHGIPFGSTELKKLASRGWSLIWSPSSNMRLYQQTANIAAALSARVNVAIAPDWNLGGSPTVLQELGYVRKLYPSGTLRRRLSSKRLVEMATVNAAKAIGLDKYIGKIKRGYRADIIGLKRKRGVSSAYDNLVASDPRAVELVMVNGKAVVVSSRRALKKVPKAGTCERMTACKRVRYVCFESSVAGLVKRVKAAYPKAAPLADCKKRPMK